MLAFLSVILTASDHFWCNFTCNTYRKLLSTSVITDMGGKIWETDDEEKKGIVMRC